MKNGTQTITVTMTLAEARSVEAQLIELERASEGFVETVPAVQRERDRLESARIRLTKAIDEKVKA